MSFGGFSWEAIKANVKEKKGAFAPIDVDALNFYNQLLTQDGFDMDKALAGTEAKFGKLSAATQTYIKNAKGSQVETGKLSKSLATLGLKGFAAQAGMMALNAALNVGISLAVSAAITGIYNLITAQERAIEKAGELQAEWANSASSIAETKSTVEGLKGEYETLAQGVDSLGNNVSLTADEYARYNQIANQIANLFPEMVQGYTAEGNAIIKNAGNVNELTAAYERLAEAQRSTVVSQANDVIKGIQGQITGHPDRLQFDSSKLRQYEALQEYFGFLDGSIPGRRKADALLNDVVAATDPDSSARAINTALQSLGLSTSNMVESAYENRAQLQAYMRSLGSQISSAAAGYYPIIEALLGGEEGYKQLTDETQALISSVVYGLDPKKFLAFEDYNSLGTYLVSSIVTPFEDAELSKTINDALDVKELVDDSVASFGHLETAYARVGKAVEGLAPEVQEAILSMFDLGEGKALIERLSDSVTDPSFLRDFTLDELRVAAEINLDPEVKLDEEALRTRISGVQEKVAQTVAEITNSYNQTTKAQDALNAAMSETEAIGAISAETYQSLIEANREFAYALDDTNGYLNINYREAQKVIDAEYKMQKAQVEQAKVQNKLNYSENAKRLREISAALREVNPETEEYNSLIAEQTKLQSDQSGILSEIKNLEILASTLAYATSAYKKWLDAQNAPEDSDIFDSLKTAAEQITEGLKTGKTGTRKFATAAEVLFGPGWEDASNAELKAWVKNVEKYFTGDSTGIKKGLDKFVKAGLVTKEGKTYLAEAGHSVEEYAAALGMGTEATRYFLAALRDYGFEIDIPGMGENTEQILAYEQAMDKVAEKQAEYQKLLSEFDPSKATQADIDAINAALEAYKQAQAEAESLKLAPETTEAKSEIDTLKEQLEELKLAYADLEALTLKGFLNPDDKETFTTILSTLEQLGKMPDGGYEFKITTGSEAATAVETAKQLQSFITTIDAAADNGVISYAIAAELKGDAQTKLDAINATLDAWNGEGADATVTVEAKAEEASKDLADLADTERKATINTEVDPTDKAEVESWFSKFGGAFTNYMNIKYGSGGGTGSGEETPPAETTPSPAPSTGDAHFKALQAAAGEVDVEGNYDLDNSQALAAIDEAKAHAEDQLPLIDGGEVVGDIPPIEVETPDVTIPVGADTGAAASAVSALKKNIGAPVTIPVNISTTNTLSRTTDNDGHKSFIDKLTVKAFSKGTHNAPGGTALVGEGVKNGKYQPEIVVKSKTGEYFVTDQPQLVDLDRGDQVINGEQTKKILGNKRPKGGKAYAAGFMSALSNITKAVMKGDGTSSSTKKEEEVALKDLTNALSVAAASAAAKASNDIIKNSVTLKGTLGGDDKPKGGGGGGGGDSPASSSGGGGSSGSSSGPDFVDWIQRLLERLKKYTEKLVRQAEKAIGFTAKNSHLDKAIENIEIEVEKNQAAYDRYMKQADSVGLSDELKAKVREGDIDIASYDDRTRELITNYQKWYDLANDCLDTVEELKDQQIELSHQKLDNINAYYENRIDRLQAQADRGQGKIDLKAATGKEIFGGDYKTIIKATEREIEELTEQRATLNDEFEKMVASGIIQKDSDAWHEYVGQLESLDSEIIQTQIDLSGFKDALANLPITNLQYAMNALQETQKVMENMLSLHEAQNADNEAGDYEKLIRNSIEQISNLEKQNILLREQLLGLDVLSEKYQEIQSQIADNEDEILNAKIAQEEWNDAILDLKISKLEQEREELEKTNDAYQRQKELQEALDDLEKAKRQKTVRIYKENVGYTFEQDRDALQEAQDRVNEVRHQETLDKIDEAIDALEDQKKDDNVYDYHGNLIKPFANGGIDAAGGLNLLHGSPSRVETIFNAEDGKKLFDLIHGSDNLTHELVKKFDASALLHQIEGVSRGNVSTFTMGDIVIQHADDADGLAQDIIKYFPNALLTEMYKN